MKKIAVLAIIISLIITACDDAGKSNEPPQIDDLSGNTIRMNENTTSNPLDFQIRDSETIEGNLTVVGISSNVQLINTDGIVITGSTRERQVTLTPNENETGSATISIRVFDQENDSIETQFSLVVDNVIPGISNISNQSLLENSAGGSVDFTLTASEFPVNELVVEATSGDQELIPNSNISITGSGANRTLTYVPTSQKSGSAVIHVSVSDPTDADESSDSFTVTVTDYDFSITAGENAFISGDYSDAVAHFNDAVSIYDTIPVAYEWLGWAHFKNNDVDNSLLSFDEMFNLNGDPSADAYAGYAFSLNANKDYDDSNSNASTALNEDDEWSFAFGLNLNYEHLYLLRAMNYFNLADFDKSLEQVQLIDDQFDADLSIPEGQAELAAKIQDLQSMMKM